ncbi:hypothetical protein GCM10012275_63360 [Longimycelium tulufanense]|uniref:Lsr2 family protein n=1 Tax=Longimycelium tulufanense TaxID=907463 RepID=A0A8J3CL98_9PSEU|nr:hypothetical protein GCM10012275_63360 [Longimycelium tulufanense]
MAQRVTIQLVDDLDGGPATQMVTFALDGVTYEIDLSESNAGRLRGAFAAFIAAARRAGGTSTQGAGHRRPSRATTAARREELQAIREWARANGHPVSDRGRIPADIVDAYHNRHHVTEQPAAQEDAPAAPVPTVPTVAFSSEGNISAPVHA